MKGINISLNATAITLKKKVLIVLFPLPLIVQGQEMDSLLIQKVSIPNLDQLSKKASSTDSILYHFMSSTDELSTPGLTLYKEQPKDSMNWKQQLHVQVQGKVGASYQYGLLTGYVDPNSTNPLNVFNSRGDLSLEALAVPLNLSYNYSTFLNPLGVNNYVRCSVDTDKLKQQASDQKAAKLAGLRNSSESLQQGKEALQAKLGMGEVLLQKYSRELGNYQNQMDKYEAQLGTEMDSLNQTTPDTAYYTHQQGFTPKRDSLMALYSDARGRYDHAKHLYDTLQRAYDKVQQAYALYEHYQQSISSLKDQASGLSITGAKDALGDKLSIQKQGMLSGLKTLDLGLSYPKTTALSKNSVPIKGAHVEFQKEHWYLTFCSGVTMNNLMVSTDAVQNKLNNSSNLFNRFDFQNIRERGWLTAIKTGYGTPESTHFYFGMRYLTNAAALPGATDSAIVPSFGNEIDIRFVPSFSKGTVLDLVYGKTSLRSALSDSLRSNVFQSLYSTDRTHTALCSVSQNFKKIRTVVQSSVRWIDPFADVRSLGVLQPDNARFEMKSTSHVSDGLSLGLSYRKDQNNLMGSHDTTAYLRVIGGQLNGTIATSISFVTSVSYLTQELFTTQGRSTTNNYLIGIGLCTAYEIGTVKNTLAINYNDYLITDTLSTGVFRSLTLQQASKFLFGVNRLSLSYFRMNDENLMQNTSYILGDEVAVQRKKLKLLLGVKLGFTTKYGVQPGGKLEATFQMSKQLEWSLSAERMVLGDFYNYCSLNRFERFPYAIMTRMGWHFGQ